MGRVSAARRRGAIEPGLHAGVTMENARPFNLERRPRRGVRVIALTPLIDMVFILLIFFMLASSFIDWRVLDLAESAANPVAEPLVLSVGAEGELVLDGTPVRGDNLVPALRSRVASGASEGVVVVPHPDLPLSVLVPILDVVEAADAGPLTLSGAAR